MNLNNKNYLIFLLSYRNKFKFIIFFIKKLEFINQFLTINKAFFY